MTYFCLTIFFNVFQTKTVLLFSIGVTTVVPQSLVTLRISPARFRLETLGPFRVCLSTRANLDSIDIYRHLST